MRSYCVLLHIFAALLLCDYGMFSMPATSPSEMSTTAISDTSNSNTTVMTAESTTVGNDSRPSESGSYPHTTQSLKNGQINDSILDDPRTTESSKNSDKEDGNRFGVSSSTAHPQQDSTTKANQHIRMISEGSCDTEDWSNDAENSGTGAKNKGSESLTGGIILLILILILIVCLLVILYFLRKKARSYSFDLTRVDIAPNDYVDTPLRSDQQGISYEQTNKDLSVCLDYVQEDKSEEKTSPIANGSAGEKTEQTPTSENDYQNFPEENSFSSDSSLASPMKKVEFNLDLDLLESDSEFNCTTEAETTDADQNENNNNVSNAGQGTAAEIFTEINLDEPKEHATV